MADGETVKTISVYSGYKLTDSDYPRVPYKAGYEGSWQKRTAPVTSNVTINAVYTQILHTVSFRVMDEGIIHTMEVPDRYVLQEVFSRQSGSWYLTGLTDSETKPESADSAASAAEPAPLAESEVNDAILATAGDSAAASAVADEAAPADEAAESTPAESTEASSESPAA